MRAKLIYFAYPYSADPSEMTRQIKQLVTEMIENRAAKLGFYDIVPLVPHCAFDALYDYPTGYECTFMLQWEYEILTRCDYICLPPTEVKSTGRIWETEFCNWWGVSLVDFEKLWEGGKI